MSDIERVKRAAAALEAEVDRLNEYYGLDNWTFEEVARFVLEHADPPAGPGPRPIRPSPMTGETGRDRPRLLPRHPAPGSFPKLPQSIFNLERETPRRTLRAVVRDRFRGREL